MSALNCRPWRMPHEVLEQFLCHAQVGPEHHRHELGAAHGILAPVLAEIRVLRDECLPGVGLGRRRERHSTGGELLEVHLGSVLWDVDQVVARPAIAVDIAGVDVAEVSIRVAFQDDGEGRGAEVRVLSGVRGRGKHTMAGRITGIRQARVVRITLVLVVVPGAERDGPGIDGVLGLAVPVPALDPEAGPERLLDRSAHRPGATHILVLEDDGVGDGRVDPVGRTAERPARAGIRPGEGRVRRREVRVDVVEAVHVPVVQELDRGAPPAGQPLVEADAGSPHLGELEVRIRHGQLVAGRRRARDVGRLVSVRIGAERPCRRVVDRLEAREHAGVPDLVRDPDVGRAPREDARSAAHLRVALAVDGPVEADARRPEDLRAGQLPRRGTGQGFCSRPGTSTRRRWHSQTRCRRRSARRT